MNYASFCDTLTASLLSRLDSGTSVRMQQIQKNNGICLDALCFFRDCTRCSPLVYLDPLYDEYLSGGSLDEICSEILRGLRKEPPFTDEFLERMQDIDSVKDLISFRLISRKDNKTLLSDVPWVPFLDLAMVFYLYLGSTASTHTTALIHTEQMTLWHLSTESLYCLAVKNTPRLFPASIYRLEDLLAGELISSVPSDPGAFPGAHPLSGPIASDLLPDSSPALYVLTNSAGIHGAACLAYRDIIKNFADQAGMDLIILPSSIHEVLLIPDTRSCRYEDIRDMIKKVNSEDVPPEDRLSDELYLYDRSSCRLMIWNSDVIPDTPEPV